MAVVMVMMIYYYDMLSRAIYNIISNFGSNSHWDYVN